MTMRNKLIEAAARAVRQETLEHQAKRNAMLAKEGLWPDSAQPAYNALATAAVDTVLGLLATEVSEEMEADAVRGLTNLGWDDVERQDVKRVWQAMLGAIK